MAPSQPNGQFTAAHFDLPPDDFRTLAKLRAQSTAAAVNDNAPAAANDDDKPSKRATEILRRLTMVAWLAILLGIAMQALSLTGRASVGAHPTLMQIAVELTQSVTWSFFVCAGIGLGSLLGKARPALGGLIGAISAPLAMGLAKGSQKVMASAIGAAEKPVIMSLMTLGVLRALEYGLLGWALAWLASKSDSRAWHFVVAGALAGIVFGGSITWLTIDIAAAKGIAMASPQILATAINEMIFPIGCSLVVYIALRVGRQLKLVVAD
jgi:hypothetical protein